MRCVLRQSPCRWMVSLLREDELLKHRPFSGLQRQGGGHLPAPGISEESSKRMQEFCEPPFYRGWSEYKKGRPPITILWVPVFRRTLLSHGSVNDDCF